MQLKIVNDGWWNKIVGYFHGRFILYDCCIFSRIIKENWNYYSTGIKPLSEEFKYRAQNESIEKEELIDMVKIFQKYFPSW